MRKQYFKYYYLANTLIASAWTVKLFNRSGEFICDEFDNYFTDHREELYERNVYYISIKKDINEIHVMFTD